VVADCRDVSVKLAGPTALREGAFSGLQGFGPAGYFVARSAEAREAGASPMQKASAAGRTQYATDSFWFSEEDFRPIGLDVAKS
jgi:hypothetical protein